MILKGSDSSLMLGAVREAHNETPSPEAFRAVELTPLSRDESRRRTWLMLKAVPEVGTTLADLEATMMAVLSAKVSGGLVVARMAEPPCIMCMMQKTGRAYPPAVDVANVTVLGLQSVALGAVKARDLVISTLAALLAGAVHYHANVRVVEDSSPSPSDAPEAEPLFDAIATEWSLADAEAIERQVAMAKLKKLAKRSLREQLVVQCSSNLRAVARSKRQATCGVRHFVSQGDVPELAVFTGLDDQLCKRLDMETGEVLYCTISQWLHQGLFASHSLLLLGPAHYGKTPLCRALAGVIARATQSSPKPYFLQSSTLDSLRSVSASLAEPAPIILDDFTAATAPRLTEDMLKHVLTCTGREVLSARYEDVPLPEGARLISSNAKCISEWTPLVPAGVWSMPAESRKRLSANALAILKRVTVCTLSTPLLPKASSKRHAEDVATSAARKVARLLGGAGSSRGYAGIDVE